MKNENENNGPQSFTTDQRINVTAKDGNVLSATVVTDNGKRTVRVRYDDGTERNVNRGNVTAIVNTSSSARIADMSEAERAAVVRALLIELQDTTDQRTKKTIRRKLRAHGHRGGLRSVRVEDRKSA